MDAAVRDWMKVLTAYAEDWDETFRKDRGLYFTQEYWYLFTECVRADADGEPLTRQEAMRRMRVSFSEDAKVDRIDRAVDDGWLVQDKSRSDLRVHLLLPTDKLRKAMNEHLVRTLNEARRVLGTTLAQ
ncbi:MAG TPA: hypothetical protein VE690_04620 [Rhodopila sp.]|nr:hypothetical protein [Rhodopila sp.]